MEVALVVLFVLDTIDVNPELVVQYSVSEVGSLHILVGKTDGDDEVDVEMVDHVHQKTHEHDQAGVLEVGELDVHGPELDSPPDVRSLGGRRLEPHGVPVG